MAWGSNSSTISGNKVTGDSSSGGGIWSRFGKGAIKELFNSTVSGNTASVGGGGISLNVCSAEASRALNIYNSTIAFNTAGASGGGGLYVGNVGCPASESGKPTSALVAITSSILSNNSSDSASSSDIVAQTGFALTVDTRFDLIRNPSGSGITFDNTTGSPPSPRHHHARPTTPGSGQQWLRQAVGRTRYCHLRAHTGDRLPQPCLWHRHLFRYRPVR